MEVTRGTLVESRHHGHLAEVDGGGRPVAAMLARPDLVEGDGELETELMRRGRGRLVSKVGAEGVYTAGVLPCEAWPRGLGLAFKNKDGDRGNRARAPSRPSPPCALSASWTMMT